MWPLALLAAGLLLAAAAKQKKEPSGGGAGPLEEEPSPERAAQEAAAAAQDALDQASAGAAEGGASGAAQTHDALDQAADAAAAAAGSPLSDIVTSIAKQVEAIAKQTSAAAGVPQPTTKSPTESPGLPPIKQPKAEEPTVVVEPAPAEGQPIPPPPKTTATPAATPTATLPSIDDVIKATGDVLKSLPVPVPLKTGPGDEPPLAKEETKPELDPNGTIALARAMLDRETEPNWETALKDQIREWQKKMGLTADGIFGPKSALTMADEVGVLPFVREWPKGSNQSTVLKKYRNSLHTKAANLESQGHTEHAKALDASAENEDARTFLAGSNPPPVTSDERLERLNALMKKVA